MTFLHITATLRLAGILQCDCYSGFEPLFDRSRRSDRSRLPFATPMRGEDSSNWPISRKRPGTARRANRSRRALEAVRRLDALFEIERAINGCSADERRAVRQEKSKPLLDDMHTWLLHERETLSRSAEVLKPINYMLRRWGDFARFLDDGRICLSNNAAERARRNWTFAGSQRGADRAAVMLIRPCQLYTAQLAESDAQNPLLGRRWHYLPGCRVRDTVMFGLASCCTLM